MRKKVRTADAPTMKIEPEVPVNGIKDSAKFKAVGKLDASAPPQTKQPIQKSASIAGPDEPIHMHPIPIRAAIKLRYSMESGESLRLTGTAISRKRASASVCHFTNKISNSTTGQRFVSIPPQKVALMEYAVSRSASCLSSTNDTRRLDVPTSTPTYRKRYAAVSRTMPH